MMNLAEEAAAEKAAAEKTAAEKAEAERRAAEKAAAESERCAAENAQAENDFPRQIRLRLLGWDDLRNKGIKDSKPTVYRKMKAGKFPKPVYPGKSPAWPEHEIDAHILSLIARRDASNGGTS